jgi:hypothetical protein
MAGREHVAYAAPFAGNCLNPEHDNAASIWNWTASDGSNGQFTAVQTDLSDILADLFDLVAFDGLLNEEWGSIIIKLGSSAILIANGVNSESFSISFLNLSGDAEFNGFAFVSTGLVTYHATLANCYNSLAPNASMELLENDSNPAQGPSSWSESGSTQATTTPVTGDRSVSATSSTCDANPSGGTWESSRINVTNSEYTVGAMIKGSSSSAEGVVGLNLWFLGIFSTYVEVASSTGADWDLASGSITIPGGVTQVSIVLSSNSCPGGTSRTATFDDVFIVNNGSNPPPSERRLMRLDRR